MCVSKDERRYKPSSVECDQQGPRCTLRTTWCCVSRQGSHAALALRSAGAEWTNEGAAWNKQVATGGFGYTTLRILLWMRALVGRKAGFSNEKQSCHSVNRVFLIYFLHMKVCNKVNLRRSIRALKSFNANKMSFSTFFGTKSL